MGEARRARAAAAWRGEKTPFSFSLSPEPRQRESARRKELSHAVPFQLPFGDVHYERSVARAEAAQVVRVNVLKRLGQRAVGWTCAPVHHARGEHVADHKRTAFGDARRTLPALAAVVCVLAMIVGPCRGKHYRVREGLCEHGPHCTDRVVGPRVVRCKRREVPAAERRDEVARVVVRHRE
eukprot:5696095-Prymnesium_polylepis.1